MSPIWQFNKILKKVFNLLSIIKKLLHSMKLGAFLNSINDTSFNQTKMS